MNKICPGCRKPAKESDLFCSGCGAPIPGQLKENENRNEKADFSLLQEINQRIRIRNSQKGVVNISLLIAVIASGFIFLTRFEWSHLFEMHALTFIGIFILISALTVAFLFSKRSQKLESLISGEKIVVSWKLSDQLKELYVDHYFHSEKAKNRLLFGLVTLVIFAIFGIFLLFMDEGKLLIVIVMCSLTALIAAFAFGMPFYYKRRNLKGDGHVLIGKDFAYINGIFHNWDFPLSGLEKVKMIQKPFYGLQIKYYYTDRTFTNREVLNIPAPPDVNIRELVSLLTSFKS